MYKLVYSLCVWITWCALASQVIFEICVFSNKVCISSEGCRPNLLHILLRSLLLSQNPCPGVATYLPVIDNSAITFDHVLKPLPAFPTAKYPQVRLDKMVSPYSTPVHNTVASLTRTCTMHAHLNVKWNLPKIKITFVLVALSFVERFKFPPSTFWTQRDRSVLSNLSVKLSGISYIDTTIVTIYIIQDVIPEVMQWKRFPNQYLVSTEGQRKLATHWKPQWNDPLKTDLLPAQANAASELQLMTGPQPDDFVDNERYVHVLIPYSG